MRIINSLSVLLKSSKSAAPARKLAAATRAVMEPIEGRMMLSGTIDTNLADSIIVTSLSSGTSTSTTSTTSTTSSTSIGVTSLSLYEADSDNKLQTLTNGATIDLADYAGTDINIRAGVSGNVGSVRFAVNGNSNYRTENVSTFDLAGSAGVWNPNVGTYTITATAYTLDDAAGTASTSYTVSFKIIDSSVSSTGTPATQAPDSPKYVSATATSGKVTVKWTAADSYAQGYKVERSSDGGNSWKTVGLVTTSGFSDTNVTASTTYKYMVTAWNSVGWATGSNMPTVTTPSVVAITSDTPAPSDRPSADSTGPAAGTRFTNVNGFTGRSNTTYSNLHITGEVILTGLTNVTLINCVVDGNGAGWGIRTDYASNITIQNCEIFNADMAAVYGHGFKAINNYVHQCGGDGFKPLKDCLIQGNYIAQLGWGDPTAHADGVQIRGGSNIQVVGNYFDMPINVANTKSNSALFLQLNVSNVTFKDNWVRGGNYALHVFSDLAGGNATVKIVDNFYYARSAQFGFAQIGDGVVMTGNVTETGAVANTSTR